MVTLEQLLASRDARAAFQRNLLEAYPACTLVCLTVQLPGPEKRNATSLAIGAAGLEALQRCFEGVTESCEVRDLETGYEAYFLVRMDALEAKRLCCHLEETHPLGRLMDIDVFDGTVPLSPISRQSVGLSPRKCLLCNREARWCMRARTHSTEELLLKIGEMVADYEKRL